MGRRGRELKRHFAGALYFYLLTCALAVASCANEKPAARGAENSQPQAQQNGQPQAQREVSAASREVSVTFDDLPAVEPYDLATTRAINQNILAALAAHGIPAVGFVNESKVYLNGEKEARAAILARWLDAGLELGNHTYAHQDLHRTSLAAFQKDVIRGETLLKKLLAERGLKLRYFRHPYLHTGENAREKEGAQRFLAGRGYTVAPVTHDNQDWIFAAVYDRAWRRGDRRTMERVGVAYVEYMKELFQYYEGLSKEVFGREIRHVLLLHVNRLNGDYFPELVRMMEGRNYKFVPLARALEDEAYSSPDAYTGAKGPSWLQRWAPARGVKYPAETPVPEYINQQFAGQPAPGR